VYAFGHLFAHEVHENKKKFFRKRDYHYG